MPDQKITSVKMLRPGSTEEVEIVFKTADYQNVDAVFMSVDTIKKFLIPHYEKVNGKEADKLKEKVKDQADTAVMLLPHKRTCSLMYPEITWGTATRIEL